MGVISTIPAERWAIHDAKKSFQYSNLYIKQILIIKQSGVNKKIFQGFDGIEFMGDLSLIITEILYAVNCLTTNNSRDPKRNFPIHLFGPSVIIRVQGEEQYYIDEINT